jgi:hypothetical protein
MSILKNNDYIKILEYYKKPIPKSNRLLKIQAEKILSEKLCRCIKKLDPINEARSIGICTKSVLINKGLTRGKFKCKGKSTIKISKKHGNYTRKLKTK